jgi:hypothetical protein
MRWTPARAVLCTVLLFAASSAAAFDATELNQVTIINRTGYDFVYLFFSPGDSDHWGPDILGSTRLLDNGKKASFFVSYPDHSNTFDILVIDDDNDAYLLRDFEITDGTRGVLEITLEHFEGAYVLPELAVVHLRNDTDTDICFLFFSPGDSRMWGIDLLDSRTILTADDTFSFLVPVTETTRFDFQGVDEDGGAYTFWVELSPDPWDYTFLIEVSDRK